MGRTRNTLRESIDYSFLNGISDAVVKALTSGPLLTAYAVGIGVSNLSVGFLQSILPFSNLIHLVVAGELEKGKSPRKIAWISSLLARPFLLLVALAVFFQGTDFGFTLFVVPYFLSYFIAAITGGAFWPWCKELVPHQLMTSFFARRIQFIVLTKMVTVLLATFIIYLVHKYIASYELYCYSIFFILAFFAGLYCTYALYKVEDVKLKRAPETPFLEKVKIAIKNKSFLYLLLGLGMANFVLAFYTSFNIVFLLKSIKLSVPLVMCFTIFSNVVDIWTTPRWSKYSKKNSTPKMLGFASIIFIASVIIFLGLSIHPISDTLKLFIILFFAAILVGIGNSGYNLGVNDAAVSYVPKKMSSVYISLVNICRFGATGSGACFGGIILSIVGKYDCKWTIFFIVGILLFLLTRAIARNIAPVNE